MEKLIYKIDSEKCVKCGICQRECPASCIKPHKKTEKLIIIEKNCIHCGHCGAVCPQGAITCDGEELMLLPSVQLSEGDIFHFITGKRSVRHYQEKAVSQDIIDKILMVGSLTATATNSQDVKISLFKGVEVPLLTAALSVELLKIIRKINNPLGRLFARLAGHKAYAKKKTLSAFEGILKKGVEGKGDPLFFGAPVVVNVTFPNKNKRFGRTNAVLAGQNMMLYAHSLGIESCMIGFAEVAGKGKRGQKALRSGKKRTPGLIFTLGYGKPKYYRKPKRKPLN